MISGGKQIILAYIDPGSGSFIVQMILGMFVAALMTIKQFWQKIISTVKKIFSKSKRK